MQRSMERVLPAEILSMIFGEEADDHSPILSFRRSRNLLVNPESNLAYGTSDIRYETSLKPIALLASKVCQHWCNIAESNGTLYSTDVIWVDRRNPYIKKSTKAFLGHLDATSPSDINISCLFSVSWDHIEENLGSTFSLLLQPLLTDYGHRIVALDVTFANFRGITSFLEAFNCLQLPRLQRFGLRKFEYFADAVVVPRRIIAPPQSHITVLSIDFRSATEGWASEFGRNLVVLKLNFNSSGRPENPTWIAIVNDLGRCQQLRHLVLSIGRWGFPGLYGASPQQKPVALPTLKSVSLKAHDYHSGAPFWWLFFWIKVPLLEEIVVTGWYFGEQYLLNWETLKLGLSQIDLPSLQRFSSLKSNPAVILFLGHAKLPPLDVVCIGGNAGQEMGFEESYVTTCRPITRHLTLAYCRGYWAPFVQDYLRLQGEMDSLRLTSDSMRLLPGDVMRRSFLQVHRLTIDSAKQTDKGPLNAWLGILPVLDTLVLPFTEVTGEDLFNVLENMQQGSAPRLRKLVLVYLHYIRFERRRFGKRFVERLARWIKAREVADTPIHSVEFSRGPTPASLADLRSFLPGVKISVSEQVMRDYNETYLE